MTTTPPGQAIRILLVDDHRTMLWGLTRLIESAAPAMVVADTACSTRELLDKVGSVPVDVVLLDLDLGGEDSTNLRRNRARTKPASWC